MMMVVMFILVAALFVLSADAYCITKGKCPDNRDAENLFNVLEDIIYDPICGTQYKCESKKECGTWCSTNECDLYKNGNAAKEKFVTAHRYITSSSASLC